MSTKAYHQVHSDLLEEYDQSSGDQAVFWDTVWKNSIKGSLNKASTGYLGGMAFLDHLLKPDSYILEAGCGKGQLVKAFSARGYKIKGVDNASETIEEIKKIDPSLDIEYGNVMDLPFADNTFTHYFSIGLIEHFQNPADVKAIFDEAKRVTKDIVFFSVPYFSKGLTQSFQKDRVSKDIEGKNFYQYYYTQKSFNKLLQQQGLHPIEFHCYSTYIGLKRHHKLFKILYAKNKVFRYSVMKTRSLLDNFFGSSYGHMIGAWCKVT